MKMDPENKNKKKWVSRGYWVSGVLLFLMISAAVVLSGLIIEQQDLAVTFALSLVAMLFLLVGFYNAYKDSEEHSSYILNLGNIVAIAALGYGISTWSVYKDKIQDETKKQYLDTLFGMCIGGLIIGILFLGLKSYLFFSDDR